MSYPKKLARLLPVKGLNESLPPHDCPLDAWTFVENARSENGFCGSHPLTRAAYADLPDDALHLAHVTAGGSAWWLACYDDEIHLAAGGNTFDITPSGGLQTAVAKDWTSCVLNGIPVVNNYVDPPHYWGLDSGVECAALPNFPAATLCKTILAFKFHLFALDIENASGEFPAQVLWSNAAEPGAVPDTWAPAADNQAGDAILADTPGPVLTGAPIRGSLILYKPSSCYVVDYVEGSDFIFSFRLLSATRGALTRKAVTPIGTGQHFVVGDGSVYLWDGATAMDISSGRINLFDVLDPDNYEILHVVHFAAENEVHINFPETGNATCSRAYVYNYVTDTWTSRELDAVNHAATGIVNDDAASNLWADQTHTWADAPGKWGATAYTLATQSLLTTGETITQIGAGANAATTILERTGIHFGDAERFKFAKRAHIRATGSGTLAVQIGTQLVPGGAVSWGTAQDFVIGTDQFINCTAQGRLLGVRVSGSGSFVVSAAELEAEVRGYL